MARQASSLARGGDAREPSSTPPQTALEHESTYDTSPHDPQRRTPHDASRNAGSSPGIIARDVLGRDRRIAGQEPPSEALRGNAGDIRRQYATLLTWAEEKGLIFDPARLGPEMDSRGEHRVHRPLEVRDAGRVLKVTLPNGSGMTRRALRLRDGDEKLMEDDALPAEYLERWELHNELLGDDAKFEGILQTPQGPAIVMSQTYVEGTLPGEKEIKTALEKQGWHPTGDGHWQRWHEGQLVGLADVKPSNWIRTATGQVFAIDVIPFIPSATIIKKWLPIPSRK